MKIVPETRNDLQDILNNILPPKEWDEEGQLWHQCVSTKPATRLDVVNLQEQLDIGLQQSQVIFTDIVLVFFKPFSRQEKLELIPIEGNSSYNVMTRSFDKKR